MQQQQCKYGVIEGDENEEELGEMKSPVESMFEVFLCG